MYEMIRSSARRGGKTIKAVLGDIRGQVFNPLRPLRYQFVAMYHSVSETADREWGPWQYAVTPEEFRSQLKRIDDEFTVITMDRLVDWLIKGRALPRDAVALTFDDAYRDLRTEVVPVLERYDVPATVYVSTGLLKRDAQAPFEYRLAASLLAEEELNLTHSEISIDTRLKTHSDIVNCYEKICAAAKFQSVDCRERILEEIGSELPTMIDVLTPDELCELRDHPLITIGAHGHNHVPLTTLSAAKQAENVQRSKDRLTEVLGYPPRHFSFPYGSFDRSVTRAVENEGFESAVTTRCRPVSSRDWKRPYTIPRIDAANHPLT